MISTEAVASSRVDGYQRLAYAVFIQACEDAASKPMLPEKPCGKIDRESIEWKRYLKNRRLYVLAKERKRKAVEWLLTPSVIRDAVMEMHGADDLRVLNFVKRHANSEGGYIRGLILRATADL